VRNLPLTLKPRVSPARKLAIGTWHGAGDPSVYGALVVEADAMLTFIEAFRERTGKRLTMSHVMAKVLGEVYEAMPDANAILRWGRIYLRKDVAVFFQVAMEDPVTGEIDLSGLVVRDPGRLTLEEIVDLFERGATAVRAGKDAEKERTRQMFRWIPGILVRSILDALSFYLYTLNLDGRILGVPRDTFGAALVTNVGSLGLDEAYAPLVPYTRAPLVISLGGIRRELLPDEDGRPRVARTLRIGATFDHRILDGVHAARMAKVVQRCFADPEGTIGR
jgi:pyruvate dehydrogenase E2 component (dihydrolipoamide acetyltransferase)